MTIQSGRSLPDTGNDSALLALSAIFRRVLQYAKNNATILCVDEFSTISKVQYLSGVPPLCGRVIGQGFRIFI